MICGCESCCSVWAELLKITAIMTTYVKHIINSKVETFYFYTLHFFYETI